MSARVEGLGDTTVIVLLIVSVMLQLAGSRATSVTIYVPPLVYVCDGFVCVEVVPSPKFHWNDVP